MSTTIQSAGYIIVHTSTNIVFGAGDTWEKAWEDFYNEMEINNIEVVDEDSEDPDREEGGDWTNESDYHSIPATAKLLAYYNTYGAMELPWHVVNDVACFEDEPLDEDDE